MVVSSVKAVLGEGVRGSKCVAALINGHINPGWQAEIQLKNRDDLALWDQGQFSLAANVKYSLFFSFFFSRGKQENKNESLFI